MRQAYERFTQRGRSMITAGAARSLHRWLVPGRSGRLVWGGITAVVVAFAVLLVVGASPGTVHAAPVTVTPVPGNCPEPAGFFVKDDSASGGWSITVGSDKQITGIEIKASNEC